MTLTDAQRKSIHDLALDARDMLTQDAREHLAGVYGVTADGRVEPADRLPRVVNDPYAAETYRRLVQFLDDEQRAGLPRPEAVDKLVKEIAFTHLNRLVAFKMMEARRLIRGTLDKVTSSNGFKIYLADHPDEMERFQRGDADGTYERFLRWQAGQVARELTVLFDPDALPSRLMPRPAALYALLDRLNAPEMAPCWDAEEAIGWVYQFFNEREKEEVFAALNRKQKIRRQDIPAATQLFTPNWIVRFLVQNTLGRTWVQMHPDTRLLGGPLLDYLVPLQGEVPAEPLRPIREITLLDPACGTMHFGLVAFDLFAAMYQEELERAGEPGWLATPSVSSADEIAAAIVAHNIYGIDIDLRAVQLSALALYLKAKALNRNAVISDSNLASADVLPLNGARLGGFLREMQFSPLIEKLIRTLWDRLQDVNQFGSLLRIEREIRALFAEYDTSPLLALQEAGFDSSIRLDDPDEFWDLVFTQIRQGLDEFAKRQAADGADLRFFTGEAVKGLRLLDVLLRRYEVVVANPPYSGKRNLNDHLAKFLDDQYPDTKGDLYTAFIERCAELLTPGGRVGMITQQSFMFLSSYESMRTNLRETAAVEAMGHTGARAFAEIGGEKVNTTVFALRADPQTERRENTVGTYVRLVNAPTGDGKRQAFERALATGADLYHVAQRKFDAIPGAPWAYWVREKIRELFVTLPKLEDVARIKHGRFTGDNFRFLRYWWEVGVSLVGFGLLDIGEVLRSKKSWIPYMKGGRFLKWYGNQEYVTQWANNGVEQKAFPGSGERNPQFYFREGVTWGDLNTTGFAVRYSPGGFLFDVKGSSGFPDRNWMCLTLALMNSQWTQYCLNILNPTASFQVGDITRVPVANTESTTGLDVLTVLAINIRTVESTGDEQTFDFIVPSQWENRLGRIAAVQSRLADLERQIDEEVFRLYGIEGEDRAAIEAELAGGVDTSPPDPLSHDQREHRRSGEGENAEGAGDGEGESDEAEAPLTREELAVRWISYAVGVVLGRFVPGEGRALGRAVYRREDFAVGSLPAPDAAEFDLLVGPAERFAYVDPDGGRHVFPAEVEQALRGLAVPDGITVLDAGHPRDLPGLVERALLLMLGDDATDDVIRAGAGGDLRKFLDRDFFTKWHVKWYRKRPVYWPLHTAKRSYGFVVFHEKIGKFTLYSLLRDYVDYRINRLRNQSADLAARRAGLAGRELKALERQIEAISGEVDELNEFLKTAEAIANEGYQPEPNWIDDGVILRMAPLWPLIPIWKSEPKKHWDKLEAGDFDWSHIAMAYWPARVREKCRSNKSFAIAHGHEEWYEGTS